MFLKIVFWAISNAPEILSALRLLMDLFRSMPLSEKAHVESRLRSALASGDKTNIVRTVQELSGVDRHPGWDKK